MDILWIAILVLLAGNIVTLILLLRLSLRKKQLQKDKELVLEKQISLQKRLDNLETKNLHFQLNPHLFKNILNTVQSGAYQTYYALDKLSHVLDYILYESNRKLVSLNEEIIFALNLIDINRIKISPLFELRVKNRITPDAPVYKQELLSPMVTVEPIENAFKHTDLQNENAFISIVFELDNGIFSLTVSNSISQQPAIRKEKSGIGMQDLQKSWNWSTENLPLWRPVPKRTVIPSN